METQKVPYEKEINQMLRYMLYEDWMTEEEWQALLTEMEAKAGLDLKELSNDIQKGVDNGYSVEAQIEVLKLLFK